MLSGNPFCIIRELDNNTKHRYKIWMDDIFDTTIISLVVHKKMKIKMGKLKQMGITQFIENGSGCT